MDYTTLFMVPNIHYTINVLLAGLLTVYNLSLYMYTTPAVSIVYNSQCTYVVIVISESDRETRLLGQIRPKHEEMD